MHQTSSASNPSQQAQRTAPRVLKRSQQRFGWLLFEGQRQGFHCQIKSLGEAGASLTVSGLLGIPNRFSLFVEPDSTRFDCRVLECRGNHVRVAFEGSEENIRFRDYAARR